MARAVAEKTAAAGGRAFFVGGYVRDKLLKRENKDIDLEVHGLTPKALEDILEDLGGKTEKGVSFGVYGLAGTGLDIAMPREETTTGRGHRDFQVYVDPFLGMDKAARRRDFTINAMMEDVLTGEVLDYFGGMDDLEKGVIRHVDDETFGEDPLRAFRGAQFAARFQFQIDEKTAALASTMDVKALAGERVLEELKKALLKAKGPSVFFTELRRMNLLDVWFPEIRDLIGIDQSPIHHPEGDVWNHTMLVVDEAAKIREGTEDLSSREPLGFMLSALCHDLGKAVTTTAADGRIRALGHEREGLPLAKVFLERMTRDKKLTRYVFNMIALHMKPNVLAKDKVKVKTTNRMFDQSLDPEGLLLLARADHLGRPGTEILQENERFLTQRLDTFYEMMKKPYIKGADLVQAGMSPGPEFTKALAYAHKLRLSGVEKEQALRQVLNHMRRS